MESLGKLINKEMNQACSRAGYLAYMRSFASQQGQKSCEATLREGAAALWSLQAFQKTSVCSLRSTWPTIAGMRNMKLFSPGPVFHHSTCVHPGDKSNRLLFHINFP